MTSKQKIEVIQAQEEGKIVEARSLFRDSTFHYYPNWSTHSDGPGVPWDFNFGLYEYRIKPEPREWILVPLEDDPMGEPLPTDTHGASLYGLRPVSTAADWDGAIRVVEVLE